MKLRAKPCAAGSTTEIIFTRGTTESINLVASSFAEAFMQPGDEVIVSVMEHHSNIVPWQLQAAKRGITIKVIPMDDRGNLVTDGIDDLFTERTKIVSIAHVSNVLGTVNPVEEIIRIAHSHNVPVMVDGAQSAPHFKVDVRSMDCDFFVFSGHKMYGPTGIGVLYGKEEWLDRRPARPTTSPHTDWQRPSNTSGGLASTTSRPTSTSSPLTAWSNSAASMESGFSANQTIRTPSFRSSWATYTTSIWAPCSTGWALPCARVTTAHSP